MNNMIFSQIMIFQKFILHLLKTRIFLVMLYYSGLQVYFSIFAHSQFVSNMKILNLNLAITTIIMYNRK